MTGPRTSAKRIDAALLRRWPLPGLRPHADKSTRGDVLVVGGSRELPGAVLLAGEAALRSGAGRARIATARSAGPSLAIAFPEARVIGLPENRRGQIESRAARVLHRELPALDALLLGPGTFELALAGPLLKRAASEAKLAVVLDAGALKSLAGRRKMEIGELRGIVVTPHAGEMAELWRCDLGRVRERPLELAVAAATCLRVTLVLKGQRTFVVDPEGAAFVNEAGNAGLATAGSGDVLAGTIAGLAARGATPIQAAVWGVHLHALAGDRLLRRHGPLGYLARELSAEFPALLHRLSGSLRPT
jgi:ADP-dependent NAD(P)H-hydrate dehydratase